MKKLVLLILLLCLQFTKAQTTVNNTITLKYENSKRIEILKKIEQLTNYKFYFIEEWLGQDQISGSYTDANLTEVLNDVFNNTIVNYYFSNDNKIILSQSVLISDKLSINFFQKPKTTTPQTTPLTKLPAKSNTRIYNGLQTIRIGKERVNSNLSSFTLRGIVRNETTNQPIPNLAIIVTDKNINAVTDIDGRYSITLPKGINFIETKSIGIQNSRKRIIIYDHGNYNFDLKESAELLKEVVIEADRDKNIRETVTGVSQIKMKELKLIPVVLGERDIFKVATTLPGITTAGEGSAGFNVRGGKEDQNLILLDNGVLYNPAHFFGLFSAINPFTSGDVNIYKGSIPVEYGGRLSSVFEIGTKNSNTEEVKGEASFGPVTSNLMLEVPIVEGKSGLIISGRGAYSNWILRSLDQKSLKNSKASFYDVIAKYNHKINEKNDLQVTGYYSDDEFSISSDTLFNYQNRLMTLNWKHKYNDRTTSNLIVANSQYTYNIGYDGRSNGDFNLGYKINETELKLKFKTLKSDMHTFDYGISTKLYGVHPGNKNPLGPESIIDPINIPKEQALESAIFFADNININKKLAVNLGFRFSNYASLGAATKKVYAPELPKNEGTIIDTVAYKKNELIKSYNGPEIRASIRYSLADDLSVKASYNTTYQYIHTLSNTTTISPTDTWKLSDLHIKPQQANQYALGIYKNIEGNTYELSLEGYYKKSKNILDYKVGASLLINDAIESEVLQGKGKAYGAELLIRKNKGNFNGWLGYTYSRSLIQFTGDFNEENINKGKYFPSNFDKPHVFDLVTNYKLTKRFSFSANFSFQKGRPVTYPIGKYHFGDENRVLYSERNKFRIPDYYRMDVGFNMEGNHKIKKFAHSFWNLSIYNVLGRNNPYSVFFVTDSGQIKAYKSTIFSIPIPTITYNFKF